MAKRKNAIAAAVLFSTLPFLSGLSSAIMALVTLRLGPKEGMLILLWSILPYLIILAIDLDSIGYFYYVLASKIAILGLATVLFTTAAWSTVLVSALGFSLLAVVSIEFFFPEFMGLRKELVSILVSKNPLKAEQTAVFSFIAKFRSGIEISAKLISCLLAVALARWWQANLYHPNGLSQELRSIRLPLFCVLVLGVIGLGTFMDNTLCRSSLLVVLFIFGLAGLSVVHSLFNSFQVSKWTIVSFYSFLILLPYLSLILVILAIIDSVSDIRPKVALRYGDLR